MHTSFPTPLDPFYKASKTDVNFISGNTFYNVQIDPDVHVLFSSGYFAEDMLASDQHILGFIDKPYRRDDLAETLDTIDTRGGTALHDALYLSLEHIREGKEDKKAILLISDGEDRDSRYKFNSVLEFAKESQASIYVIGLFDPEGERSRAQKKAATNLKELAEETGGKYFFPESADEVEALCTQVANDIRNQYTLGYTSSNLTRDGTFRSIKVIVNSPGANKFQVRAREGYLAAKEGAPIESHVTTLPQ
jgi:VWFA-related protein